MMSGAVFEEPDVRYPVAVSSFAESASLCRKVVAQVFDIIGDGLAVSALMDVGVHLVHAIGNVPNELPTFYGVRVTVECLFYRVKNERAPGPKDGCRKQNAV